MCENKNQRAKTDAELCMSALGLSAQTRLDALNDDGARIFYRLQLIQSFATTESIVRALNIYICSLALSMRTHWQLNDSN